MQLEFFKQAKVPAQSQVGNKAYEQYFTPLWAAHLLVEHTFPNLSGNDALVDAGSGRGEFISAFPDCVRGVGIEIDPALAEKSRRDTGKEIIVGDFLEVDIPFTPTGIISNPPFRKSEAFLGRAAYLLPNGCLYGAIMTDSFMSFASRVSYWLETFSIEKDTLPRDLFPRIAYTLSFYIFRKRVFKPIRGFLLFDEARIINGTHKDIKKALNSGPTRKGPWHAAVHAALLALGGQASLREIYAYLENRVPRSIEFWDATVRRCLQEGNFVNISRGVWAIAQPCA